MKAIITSLFVALGFYNLNAQTDTIYFDQSWQPTVKENASFYRLPYVPSGNGYLLRDFFISRAKQFEGISLSTESEQYDGKATWYYENGNLEQVAEYKNGLLDGEFISYDENGNQLSKGIYKENVPYEGSFCDMDQLLIRVSNYGNGEFKNAVTSELKTESKARIEVNVSDFSSQSGEIVFYGINGDKIGKLIVKDNQPYEGVNVEYFYNPMTVASITEVSGGEYKSPKKYFYRNGNIKELDYFKDDYYNVSKTVYFNTNGNMTDSLVFSDGSPLSGTKIEFFNTYDNPGAEDKIKTISTYKNGEIEGIYKYYYPNGTLQYETSFNQGVEKGDRITYDSLGNKLYTLSFKDGEPWTGIQKSENTVTSYKNGERIEEKSYYDNGQLMLSYNSDGLELAYDSNGNEISRMQYKDGLPYDGTKIEIYYGEIYSITVYSGGNLKKSTSYSAGKPSYIVDYNNDGGYAKETTFYSSGFIFKEINYNSDGYEDFIIYYDKNGNQLGKLSKNNHGEYEGDMFEFDDENLTEHNLYKDGVAIRTWKCQNGKLVSDVQYNGPSLFYDLSNNKKYTCTYKDGEPYEGEKIEFDADYNGITEISNYKNGKLDGEYIGYEFIYNQDDASDEKGRLVPEYKIFYRNGEKEGVEKNYTQGKLIKEMEYSNGMLNGNYEVYDLDGKLLSTMLYKDDYPYEGTSIEYDYYDNRISSIICYKDGKQEGEQKYYDYGELSRIEYYEEGNLVWEKTYNNGKEYLLNYKDYVAYSGLRYESYNYSLLEYADGNQVSIKTFTDGEMNNLSSLEIFEGEKSLKTSFYTNGKKKDEIEFSGYNKEGTAVFYNTGGKQIASGVYSGDYPLSGSFVYFSDTTVENYLLMQIENNSLKATEYVNGKPERNTQYNSNSNFEDVSQLIQKFLLTLKTMFEEYNIDLNNGW